MPFASAWVLSEEASRWHLNRTPQSRRRGVPVGSGRETSLGQDAEQHAAHDAHIDRGYIGDPALVLSWRPNNDNPRGSLAVSEKDVAREASQHGDAENPPERFAFSKNITVMAAALIVGLAQYTEAAQLIATAVEYFERKLTNNVEYALLDKVHVGNTATYVENLVGSAQVSRVIDEQTTAQYFCDPKFLLTIYFQNERVAAYTVISLAEGFAPSIFAGESLRLGGFSYQQFDEELTDSVVDSSKVVRFYLENLTTDRAGMFLENYLGNVEYGSGDLNANALEAHYQANIVGNESEEQTTLKAYRISTKPNLFGRGELPLAKIQKGILTAGEYKTYFGTI
jgi:hypothetical protein